MGFWSRFCFAGAVWAGVLTLAPLEAEAQGRIQRVYTAADGLAHAKVLAMTEDQDGFLWLGTEDGVSRFDGTEFTHFPAGNRGPSGLVFTVRPAADGSIWMGTPRGVYRFRQGRFSILPPASGFHGRWVQEIAAGPDGRLLLALEGRLLAATAAGRVRSTPLPDAWFACCRVVALLAARDGAVYLGAARRGGFVLRGGRVRPVAGLPDDRVFDIFEAQDGSIAWGTAAGLALLLPGEARAVAVPGIRDQVNAITQTRDGTLLLATATSGVLFLRLGPHGSVRPTGALTVAEGLPSNTVRALHVARGGTLYVGTRLGLAVSEPGPIASWLRGQGGLPNGEIYALAAAADGTPWVGTSEGLLSLRGGRWQRARHDALGRHAVTALAADSSGALYAGTESGHVAVVRGGEVLALGPRRGLAGDLVWAIHAAPDGTVYFATTRRIFALRHGRWRSRSIVQPAPALASTADGTLYIAQLSGLAASGSMRLFTPREGLADATVWSLLPGRDGALYVGTARGLSILRAGRFSTFDHRQGLANGTVQCLAQDGADRLYVGTNRGVDILALPSPPAGGAAPVHLRTLTRADGLAGEEIQRGACFCDRAGRLWFGSADGVSVYDPRLDTAPPEPPPVQLLGWQRSGADVALPAPGEPYRLGAGENRLAFSYAAVDLRRPFRGPYAYRWVGLDPAWSETEQRSVQVAHLGPGRYRFEVRAGDGAGRWGRPATLAFEVPAPFWRRPGFLALAAAALVGGATLVATARLRGLLALERLRSGIAASLHDRLGAGLCEISIVAELAERTERGGGGGENGNGPGLPRVTTLAGELAAELDDIVWLVHPRRDSFAELLLRLKDRFAEVAGWRGIEFSATGLAACTGLRLPMARREGLYALFREAFHNAVRHSGCQAIELAVRRTGRRLEISLRDDGRGFAPGAAGQGDGLANMARRAAALGGQLEIRSTPGAGTEVRFTGPIAEKQAFLRLSTLLPSHPRTLTPP